MTATTATTTEWTRRRVNGCCPFISGFEGVQQNLKAVGKIEDGRNLISEPVTRTKDLTIHIRVYSRARWLRDHLTDTTPGWNPRI